MSDLLSVPNVRPGEPARPRHRPRWLVLGAVVALIAGGVATGVAVVVRDSSPATLDCSCGLGWAPPDGARSVYSNDPDADPGAGDAELDTVPARVDARQAFYVEVSNRSSVPQTVVGLPSADKALLMRPRLEISTKDNAGTEISSDPSLYRTGPVTIPPHSARWLRYSFRAVCLGPGSGYAWSDLSIRVSADGDVRTQTIDFAGTTFVVTNKTASYTCPSG